MPRNSVLVHLNEKMSAAAQPVWKINLEPCFLHQVPNSQGTTANVQAWQRNSATKNATSQVFQNHPARWNQQKWGTCKCVHVYSIYMLWLWSLGSPPHRYPGPEVSHSAPAGTGRWSCRSSAATGPCTSVWWTELSPHTWPHPTDLWREPGRKNNWMKGNKD